MTDADLIQRLRAVDSRDADIARMVLEIARLREELAHEERRVILAMDVLHGCESELAALRARIAASAVADATAVFNFLGLPGDWGNAVVRLLVEDDDAAEVASD